jgi:hypothetical protein
MARYGDRMKEVGRWRRRVDTALFIAALAAIIVAILVVGFWDLHDLKRNPRRQRAVRFYRPQVGGRWVMAGRTPDQQGMLRRLADCPSRRLQAGHVTAQRGHRETPPFLERRAAYCPVS